MTFRPCLFLRVITGPRLLGNAVQVSHLLPAFSLQEVQIGFIGLALASGIPACSAVGSCVFMRLEKHYLSTTLGYISFDARQQQYVSV